ncbi:MAG TPA: hypothetical protein VE825_03590 [Terriglobales bacterium]|jgi:hypothetical protein|nr:hypothetical protein [Terriglobales bacterium]
MNKTGVLLLFLLGSVAWGQQPPRELYRVHFFKAAPGKLPDLIDAYKNYPAPDASTPRPMVFRHSEGADWDLMVIYPLGAQASMTANPAPLPDSMRAFRDRVMADYAWHVDTYASGPPLAEVQKALNAPRDYSDSSASSSAVYEVEQFVALPGQHDALGQFLVRDVAASGAAGGLRFDHVMGDAWDFLLILRYNSWQDLAAVEAGSPADALARTQGFANSEAIGLELRQHISAHQDTIASRVF